MNAPGFFSHDAVGGLDGPANAPGAGCKHQLGSQMPQQFLALDAHGLRHGEAQPVSAGCTDKGQSDAGVAAGGLHDQGVGPQRSVFFRIVDHGCGDAVLDAAQGIEKFKFGDDLGVQIAAGAV
jgi:hypothetical protein